MTPTLNTLLLVAAVWSLPATTAALLYRAYGSSVENSKAATVADSMQRVGNYVVATLPTV
jgi:hypothetical protein